MHIHQLFDKISQIVFYYRLCLALLHVIFTVMNHMKLWAFDDIRGGEIKDKKFIYRNSETSREGNRASFMNTTRSTIQMYLSHHHHTTITQPVNHSTNYNQLVRSAWNYSYQTSENLKELSMWKTGQWCTWLAPCLSRRYCCNQEKKKIRIAFIFIFFPTNKWSEGQKEQSWWECKWPFQHWNAWYRDPTNEDI